MAKTPGTGLLMLWCDVDEKVPESEAWRAHQFGHPWTRRVRRAMLLDEGSPGVYRRISTAL